MGRIEQGYHTDADRARPGAYLFRERKSIRAVPENRRAADATGVPARPGAIVGRIGDDGARAGAATIWRAATGTTGDHRLLSVYDLRSILADLPACLLRSAVDHAAAAGGGPLPEAA